MVAFSGGPPIWKEGRIHRLDQDQLFDFFKYIRLQHAIDDIVFLCIGSDRSTGDALGPLTGSRLVTYGFTSVVGTLQQPCDATHLERRIGEISSQRIIIAIDACLGLEQSSGYYLAGAQPLTPAQSVGSKFPPVGHFSIAGVVNRKGPRPYHALQTASLYQVMQMAEAIASAAFRAFYEDNQTPI